MKIAVYNKEGKETGEITLLKDVFEVQMNSDLVHQVLISQRANQRQVSAHTKTRAEVRGGGRKPWRQKGTGRARHGSIRSPLWKGGGVTGGPRNDKNFEREIPRKMRKKALSMVLSEKAKNNLLVVLDKFDMENAKTKIMSELIKKLPLSKGSRLVLYTDGNLAGKNSSSNGAGKKVFLSARNIAKTGVLEARNLNIVDLLNYKFVLISEDGIKEIESTFGDKSEARNPKSETNSKSKI